MLVVSVLDFNISDGHVVAAFGAGWMILFAYVAAVDACPFAAEFYLVTVPWWLYHLPLALPLLCM